MTIRHQSGQKTVATPVSQDIKPAVTTKSDPALVQALVGTFRYQRLLDEGRYALISEMAKAECIERGYLGSLLRLTLLAPDSVEAILNGTQLADLELATLMEPIPSEWHQQRCLNPLA